MRESKKKKKLSKIPAKKVGLNTLKGRDLLQRGINLRARNMQNIYPTQVNSMDKDYKQIKIQFSLPEARR